ncbi:MAG: hypothetical protein P9M02_03190 [Candidatus Susulua stagnicola]|nr:hypothetical protein [Candidatus Susulua stagnicola]
MTRSVDIKNREREILGLIIDSYIEESKPISSAYICQKYHLACSTATIRNIMVLLEKQGFLSHLYTSSGRVPTQEGFRCYVENCDRQNDSQEYSISLDSYASSQPSIEDVISHTLDALVQLSGYTSLMAVSGRDEKIFFRGMRFMLEQPEFEDVRRLKDIFYTLEVKMGALQNLFFDSIDDGIRILIGDDIGFEEIADCSLVISGLRDKDLSFAFALLGPMRMNYNKATSSLQSVRNRLKETVEEFI